jgi:hypothetical protein
VEFRTANAIPIVASLLFGPAAAWGAGIGNIIGDCFGTLGPASMFGFLGNFFFGYLPYLMWGHLGWLSSGQPPMVKSWRQGLEYGLVCVVASGACAGIIGWGVELLGLLPFIVLAPAIFFNNIVMGLFLGPPLLGFLYPRVQRWQLRYEDINPTIVPLGNSGDFHRASSLEDNSLCNPFNSQTHFSLLRCQEFSFSYSVNSSCCWAAVGRASLLCAMPAMDLSRTWFRVHFPVRYKSVVKTRGPRLFGNGRITWD